MFVWKQLGTTGKNNFFIAAQLRGIIKYGRVRPQTQKLFSKSCFLFLEDTMVNYADAPIHFEIQLKWTLS